MAGFDTPAPDAATAEALRALQTGDHAVLDRNPIDVTLAGLKPELLRGAINVLLQSPTYDALTIIVGSSSLAMPELMAGAIQDCLPNSDKPIIAYVSPHAPEVGALLTAAWRAGVCRGRELHRGVARHAQRGRFQAPAEAASRVTLVAVDDLPSGSLDEAQAKQLFTRFGVPCAPERIVTSPAQAEAAARELGGRVVLKILSSEITHKTEVGGVAINLTPESVGARLTTMAADVEARAGVRPQRFLVQEMVGAGTELILGMHRDALGTAILLGMGGVTAELFKDTTMRLLPPEGGAQSRRRAGHGAGAEDLAAARRLSRPPQSGCRSPGVRDRCFLRNGRAARREARRGGGQSGVRAGAGTGCPRRRRRRRPGLRRAR